MTKPWGTTAWRKRRAEFIKGKSCEWCGEEAKVIHHPNYLNPDGSSISNEQYLDWENTRVITLCRGCHLNYHKGYVPCKKCGKKWHSPRFEMCWECFKKTERGKEVLKERAELESEEEVPLIKVTLPCLQEVQVYENQFEYGGIMETCIHQCPFPDIGGHVNNCTAFMQNKKEEDEALIAYTEA